jgi:hypothetical protein
MADDSSPEPNPPIRARRWSRPTPPPPERRHRLAVRLIGIPVVAVAGVFIYSGLRDHFVLPECDSDRAKHTLADVLKQLKLEPTKYEPIKTVSRSQDQVVCNAVLPLPDGGTVTADYTFYWDGGKANMKYSLSRKSS